MTLGSDGENVLQGLMSNQKWKVTFAYTRQPPSDLNLPIKQGYLDEEVFLCLRLILRF